MEKRIKIIVTEDSETWRVILRRELAPFEIDIIAEAENGKELLKHLETLSPDVILLDLAMKEMDGNETMYWLNEKYPEQKVIIMSLFDDPTLMEDYVMRDVKGCISKTEATADMEGLAAAIRKIAKGGKHFNYDRDKQLLDISIRQKEIINLAAKGKSQKQIAAQLGITTNAVEKQKNKIMKTMNVNSLTELMARIFESGFHFFRGPK